MLVNVMFWSLASGKQWYVYKETYTKRQLIARFGGEVTLNPNIGGLSVTGERSSNLLINSGLLLEFKTVPILWLILMTISSHCERHMTYSYTDILPPFGFLLYCHIVATMQLPQRCQDVLYLFKLFKLAVSRLDGCLATSLKAQQPKCTVLIGQWWDSECGPGVSKSEAPVACMHACNKLKGGREGGGDAEGNIRKRR